MTPRKGSWFLSVLVAVALATAASARGPDLDKGGRGLALALRRLPVTESVLLITAHPDDEDNALLVRLRRGEGVRTGLLTLTRGEGGQNEIGPELFQALGIIRTGELMAVHDFDGARQFFTRAYEFGYSFSVEETLQRWGEEEILSDIVRVIRTFRPQVILSLPRGGTGGGQHHQASALLAEKAFHAAGDADRFPEQLEQGLPPWQALRLYERVGWEQPASASEFKEGVVTEETGQYDPVLGLTYAQLGAEARAMHRCQGMPQIVPMAGESSSRWHIVALDEHAVTGAEKGVLSGLERGLTAMPSLAGVDAREIPDVLDSLERIRTSIGEAQRVFDVRDPALTAPFLAQGLETLRNLQRQVHDLVSSDRAREEMLFLLQRKEEDFQDAFRLAHQLVLEAVVNDGNVTPGQVVTVTLDLLNGGTQPIRVVSSEMRMQGKKWSPIPGEWTPTMESGTARTLQLSLRIPERAMVSEPYWRGPRSDSDRYDVAGVDASAPWSQPQLEVRLLYRSLGAEGRLRQRVEYRYADPIAGGEQRHELMVVPRISVAITPDLAVIPLSQRQEGLELQVDVTNNGENPASGVLRLEAPPDWKVEPDHFRVEIARENETASRLFRLLPSGQVRAGTFEASASASFGDRVYRRGFQVIDYPHIERRHLYHTAVARLLLLDVKVTPGLVVGYITGVGDEVAEALKQLGAKVELLSSDDLAGSDLSRFDTIVTGVRAYLNRADLRAHNDRLLDWVSRGGTLIVQYNKFEFNAPPGVDSSSSKASPYAPYPALVSHNRVTDETAPVRILQPGHPVFQTPNRLGPGDWAGWVQERGLYFLGAKDPRYVDLLATEDPYPFNAGEKRGALVDAEYGKGHWVYVGLALWRQIAAGVPGSYRLLANLVSLGSDAQAGDDQQSN